MPVLELPRMLTLPSGSRVALRRRRRGEIEPRHVDGGAPLFADALAVLERDVAIERGKVAVDPRDLPLADFHVLRAILTKAGFLEEDEVELDCHNCGELLVVRPCERLEIGPWRDGELDDPELDRTAELGVPRRTPPIPLGRVRVARSVTLAPRTVGDAAPLFAALARDPFEVDEGFVRGLGVQAIGQVTDPALMTQALAGCDDAAFGAVTDAFLDAHYPPRLASDVFCPKCKAKNTVAAPALREFDYTPLTPQADESGPSRRRAGDGSRDGDSFSPLPPLDEFVELAHAIADPLIAEIPGDKVMLVVEDGTPAVDDGGEPLLGSYLPPPPKDSPVPTRPPTVTIYYRTFEAIEREEGPYDWEGELTETIEHELEHHVYFLRGDDPMDEAEHAEIDREALRIVGRGEAKRRALAGFGESIPEFFRRAWPLVLIGALAVALTIAEGRCAAP